MGRYGLAAWARWGSGDDGNGGRPTECVSPKGPRGSSALRRPRRIFSSLGKGGKKRGGGGWPGKERSGKLGGAEVNALKLCAYARSSGYGIAPAFACSIAARRTSPSAMIVSRSRLPSSSCTITSRHEFSSARTSDFNASMRCCFFGGYELTAQPQRVPHLLQRAHLSEGAAAVWCVTEKGTAGAAARRCSGDSVVRGGDLL